MSDLQRWTPDRDVKMELVLTEWDGSEFSQWVRAEDAIKREAELLGRIRELEERVVRSAALVSKAVALMSPPKGSN